ncbi:DUF1120 domain-containing protein [Achromobacter xylosoxidans]|uniref:DUF1120 domain-containing protein n=1 Tax=Alcaligenes xylosoxydans xylosoxydans TaxID=85698 RepID=UPI0006C5FDC6|nr:DUF1120 domain-containing protein [Achromobacter xylosoxidans]MCH1984789.1 DUF1120 domain-containing protein [Achromobacter xylosoxidans]MCH1997301.1 DUF1120 domain-containing protein [Achromobacter xylosoxidans]MCH4584456.1 DUF1120 domain-containing protein [Achromobacter xylosoxidans]CUI38875.1 Protein of uncharacterised function (DUF1120) [Achromobacter xylosoxidans]CUI59078.1 Protein of uncharacterised function (DUF1120) [Achromobacter xylosoxidans]
MHINQKLAVLAVAGTASLAGFSVQAQSIDVRVIGTITPPACVPTISGGGIIDYGNIAARTLNKTAVTQLPDRSVPFSISCDAPTQVAIAATDNRASSRVPGILNVLGVGASDNYNFGLGTVSGANVGGFALRMAQGTFTTDGVNAFTVASTNGGTSWTHVSLGMFEHTNWLTSWSGTQGGAPRAFTNLTGTMTVQTVLNRGDALPLGNDVPLDGLATLQLTYL